MYNEVHDIILYLIIEIRLFFRGVFIRSIWDLVNMDSNKYLKHADILLKYLNKFKIQKMKEPIVRALSVKGYYTASAVLIDEFLNSEYEESETSYRWLVGNALYEIKDRSIKKQIKDIVDIQKYKKDSGQLVKLLEEI